MKLRRIPSATLIGTLRSTGRVRFAPSSAEGRMPYRSVETTEQTGHTIYEVERFELGVELNRGVFTLQRRPLASAFALHIRAFGIRGICNVE